MLVVFPTRNNTNRAKEAAHVPRVGIDDQLVDVLLADLLEHLAVGGGGGLADVHVRAGVGWRLDELLQLEEACKCNRGLVVAGRNDIEAMPRDECGGLRC